ncbi:MAG: hypothetical protein QXP02_04205 [Desulfurococcaceae archaeon]
MSTQETLLKIIMNMGYTLLVLVFFSLLFAWNEIISSGLMVLVLISSLIALSMIIIPALILYRERK